MQFGDIAPYVSIEIKVLIKESASIQSESFHNEISCNDAIVALTVNQARTLRKQRINSRQFS